MTSHRISEDATSSVRPWHGLFGVRAPACDDVIAQNESVDLPAV